MGVPLGGVEWYGISWHLRICRLLCHSVALSAQCACHSVASSGMAMRQGVYGAAQGPSKRQATPNGSVTAMAPSLPAKRNTLTRLREFVWVGGCVTARAAWPSPLGRRRRSVHRLAKMASRRRFGAFVYTVATRGLCERRWGRRSVHRSVKMASRCRFGAFVYTVAPWAWVVSGLGITIVYTNGRIGPLRAGLGHLCTLLGCCAVVDNRGDAGVYTNWLKWPLDAVLEHLCTLLRRDSPRRQPTRTLEEPKMFPDWRSRRGR